MTNRLIAIGDIHGCSTALQVLLKAISPRPNDTIVTLGDYIDRGPGSRQVLEMLIALKAKCRLVPILGNHEEMLLDAFEDKDHLHFWLKFGGWETLNSYGPQPTLDVIPRLHLQFIRNCRQYFETDTHIFAHANYHPSQPLNETSGEVLRWEPLGINVPAPHFSGCVAVVGHTPQDSGRILDLGCVLGIDTGCYLGRWLTAIDVNSGQVWQTNQQGKLRKDRTPIRRTATHTKTK